MSKDSRKELELHFDVVVVGAGPAGLYQAHLSAAGGAETMLLEAAEAVGGTARSTFSLMDPGESSAFPVLTGTLLDPLVVRWERQWKDPGEVDWQSPEWEASLSQWSLLQNRVFSYFLDMAPMENAKLSIRLRSPVVSMSERNPGWLLETPEGNITANKVYWAAGIAALQNALGKREAQRALVENPKYSQIAADYRGGLGLDWDLSSAEASAFALAPYRLFALPVRFEGKYQLLFGALLETEEGMTLRTFVHLHQDRLRDPKTMSAIQKAVRRGLKTLFGDEESTPDLNPKERCYVLDRIFGHIEGTPWVLSDQSAMPNLSFIGEESLRAAKIPSEGITASLSSVHELSL